MSVFVSGGSRSAERLLRKQVSELVRTASVAASAVRMMHRHAEVITLVPSTGKSRISMVQTARETQSKVLAALLIKAPVTMNDFLIL